MRRQAAQAPDAAAAAMEALLSTYPLRRIATAQEIGEAAVWVCTKATYMTGHTLMMDAWFTCT